MTARLLPVAAALLAACATSRPPAQAPIRFPAEEVTVSAEDLELASKNDEELLAIGTAASGAGDFARAAAAFGRLADAYPGSPHAATALHGAGIAHEREGEWRLALARFRALAARAPEEAEPWFRVAECHWHLGELDEARAALDAILARDGLGAADRLRALAQKGVVELESGRTDAADRSLREAVALWQTRGEEERLDPYPAAQAQFHLGELYRASFEALRPDPAALSGDELSRALEEKAELLLSAQGHYLRTIRIGHPEWAVAAGARIGELYDAFHRQLVEAPLPAGLAEADAAAYRAELSRRVRILVTKAIGVYERTLAAAQRTGVEGPFVEETRRSLERMKRTLLEAGGADADGAAPLPADADPGEPGAP
jgi:tetratricopeptide (TPR) repeat protein